jgi:natural product biosynthesis luciferase-like monooxygenase protein
MENSSCTLIGRGPLLVACAKILTERGYSIQGVVSDCEQVEAWCQKNGIGRISSKDDQVAFLSQKPFDYLFSIVNHQITAPEILDLPRLLAINYHDSPLPKYSGFNATSWAIIDGNKQHGITWHRMAKTVDSGEILVSEQISILDEDTAFTLTAKCGDAAVRSFARVLDRLATGDTHGTPQGQAEGFHLRSERPGVALLDWTEDAGKLDRLIRGLNFGPDESWLSTPKLSTPSGTFVRVGLSTVVEGEPGAAPGQVLSIDGETIVVSTKGGALALSELSTFDGASVAVSQMSELGLVVGLQLSTPDLKDLAAVQELDARITKSERFWCSRLQRFVATKLNELAVYEGESSFGRLSISGSDSFGKISEEGRFAALLAAVGVYLSKVGEDSELVSIGYLKNAANGLEAALFSQLTPVVLGVEKCQSWRDALTVASEELAILEKRGTFSRDLRLRYPELRKNTSFFEGAPIAVSRGGCPDVLPKGCHLCFSLRGEELELVYALRSIDEAAARRLSERVLRILREGGENAGNSLDSLPALSTAEEGLLLKTWQRGVTPYADDKCVHQLFEEQVLRTPDEIALVFRSEELTYSELDRRANAVAAKLQRFGIGPDQLVGICIERSIEMMVALLGVLKAGGAYVPLDPAYPTERLSVMLNDSKAKVLISQRHLRASLPPHEAQLLLIEDCEEELDNRSESGVRPQHLAYVIFTSGSTGRPKGVMVQHGNVSNFFAGMDETLGSERGVWLAVTSISFDISVLELFWTLTRGFKVIIQEESDQASILASQTSSFADRPMGFGLFYFAADSTGAPQRNAYKVMLEGARFADTHDFVAVWTPERHFHAFGGLYPNAAVTSAAVAAITEKVQIRAGSVVLPLHNPIRVAEDWAVVDNLSGGRVGLSFASGWHANDFALMPDNFERRREIMSESIETVLKLWRGEKHKTINGEGKEIEVSVLPRPIRERPPMWVASAGNIETFKIAGRAGHNILTNMLGQDLKDLQTKFEAYHEARKENGHEGPGIISVMLHTFVCDDDEKAREIARKPFGDYLASSYDLVKVAPWMFPAFKQPSQKGSAGSAFDPQSFDDDDMRALLDYAFERYFETAGLFGTPETALRVVDQLKGIGATEVACLIDFGIDPDVVLSNLVHLDRLRQLANRSVGEKSKGEAIGVAEQLTKHHVTHLQCTPSMARLLLADGSADAMGGLGTLLMGGEALPQDLVERIAPKLGGRIINMYGPTETTIWSTTTPVELGRAITIGKPIANTTIRILDKNRCLCPVGTAGELCIGGDGVVRGYLERPDLTEERFVADPYLEGKRLYRTGDLARYLPNGELEFLGRMDQQVKLNGYRMELGEIETVMAKHSAVYQAVVAVKGDAAQPRLVGYFVPQGGKGQSPDAALDVASWGERWNEAYERKVGAEDSEARFDISGWLNSFTGAPLPEADMREWLDHTLSKIRELNPRRVLELGCGTGMILFGALQYVDHYTGVDLSSHALETISTELNPQERQKVRLLNQPAHKLEGATGDPFDLVVINSVAQYFPSTEYLGRVLEDAGKILKDRGSIFLGDLRSLQHLELFHTLIEVNQAPGALEAAALQARVQERCQNETELLIGPEFFSEWLKSHPQWSLQTVNIKGSKQQNEMTMFRYDVVLTKAAAPTLNLAAAQIVENPSGISVIEEALAKGPSVLLVKGIENGRLSNLGVIQRQLLQGKSGNADSFREMLTQAQSGVDPSALQALHPQYRVEIRWGSESTRFDALFRTEASEAGTWPLAQSDAKASNIPAKRADSESLVPKLREHLKEFLPSYMIPSAFVSMDAFPLTPNGKIDRKALPEPGLEKLRTAVVEYAVPANQLERTIVEIWQQLLGVEKVGRKDNIFDLGVSSLLTVEANNLLQTKLQRKIPLVNMFRYPTVEKLAEHLGAGQVVTPGGVDVKAAAAADKAGRVQAAAERRRNARRQQET